MDAPAHAPRKPNVGRIGRVPPPQSQHRLRGMSELGVVRIASGSEVLLPRDVPRHLERQGAQPDHALRRGVLGSGRLKPAQLAAIGVAVIAVIPVPDVPTVALAVAVQPLPPSVTVTVYVPGGRLLTVGNVLPVDHR